MKKLTLFAALIAIAVTPSAHAARQDRAAYVLGGGTQYVPHLPVFTGDNGTQILVTPACVGIDSNIHCAGGVAFGRPYDAGNVTVTIYDLVSSEVSGTVVLFDENSQNYELRRFIDSSTVPLEGRWTQVWVIPDSPKDRLCQLPCTGTAGVITAEWA